MSSYRERREAGAYLPTADEHQAEPKEESVKTRKPRRARAETPAPAPKPEPEPQPDDDDGDDDDA